MAFSLGCTNEKKEKPENVTSGPIEVELKDKKIKNQDFFTLTFNAIIEKDDTFTLFYLSENRQQISKQYSISKLIEGGKDYQTLSFKLKEDALPTRLILKFLNQEGSQNIIIDNVKIEYAGKAIDIAKENFFDFFDPNKYISYDNQSFTATAAKTEDLYAPAFISRKVLEAKMDMELFSF